MEREFAAMLLHAEADITIHTARMPLQQTTIDTLLGMRHSADAAAERLAHADVDIICYGCTSGSLIQGLEFARGISHELQAKTGIPTVTTSEAVLAACQQLGLSSLSVVTPYTEDINQREVAFFESAGIHVLAITGLGLFENLEIGRQVPAHLIPLVHKTHVPHADGVFISCTDLRTIEIIPALETELHVPVFSSNIASFYAVLKALKIKYSTNCFGILLENPG
jgi:maleate isomerase